MSSVFSTLYFVLATLVALGTANQSGRQTAVATSGAPPPSGQHICASYPVALEYVERDGNPQHIMGLMPAAKDVMSAPELQHHADWLGVFMPPGYTVVAFHEPGHKHVYAHATKGSRPPKPVVQYIVHPNVPLEKQPIGGVQNHFAAYGKIIMGLDKAIMKSPIVYDVIAAAHREVNGPGLIGTIPLSEAVPKDAMGLPEVNAHALWIQSKLKKDFTNQFKVHAAYVPGSDRVHFYAMAKRDENLNPILPSRPLTPDHPPVENIRVLSEQEKKDIRKFLQDSVAKSNPFTEAAKRNKNAGPEQQTYMGWLPAHKPYGGVGDMDEYAKFVLEQLRTVFKLTGAGADLVVATHHSPGQNAVLFHTAARHAMLWEFGRKATTKEAFKHIGAQIVASGKTNAHDKTLPVIHAEIAGIMTYAEWLGVTNLATFMEKMEGHYIGIAGRANGGEITKPCGECHITLATTTPADYRGRGARLPDGKKRVKG